MFLTDDTYLYTTIGFTNVSIPSKRGYVPDLYTHEGGSRDLLTVSIPSKRGYVPDKVWKEPRPMKTFVSIPSKRGYVPDPKLSS